MIESVIELMESLLPRCALVTIPSDDQRDVRIYVRGRVAVLHCNPAAPLWSVVDRATGRQLGGSSERSVSEMVRSAVYFVLDDAAPEQLEAA